MRLFLYSAMVLLLTAPVAAAAVPRIDVIVGADAPKIERFAGDELKAQLERLFDAQVQIVAASPADSKHTVFLGSPKTNPNIQAFSDAWPKLSEQGHVLRSVRHGQGQALLVGGDSPAATLWAVYELGQQFGIRYFLFGDLYPVAKPELKLDGFDITREPKLPLRVFRTTGDSPLGPAMWGLEEHQRVLRQLAKLKFNSVILPGETWHPPIRFRVDGDTAGRAAFRGLIVFENPDLADKQDNARRDAAIKRLQGIVETAQGLGMTISVEAARLPGSPPVQDRKTGVLPHAEYARLGLLPGLDEGRAIPLPNAQMGDLDLAANYISRIGFGETLTPEQACHDLVTPVCGEEVSTRVWKAFQFIEQATSLITRNDPGFDSPAPEMILKHQRDEPAPQWWTEAKDAYLNAMNEMYRANTRAREGGRAYTLYYARRSEFGFHYMNCLLAVRKAGIAQAKPDAEARLTELEAAVESIYAALNALAAVARSSSDRGTIAVLNEYTYRPLKRELDAASQ